MTESSLPIKRLGEVLSVVETGSRPSGGASHDSFGVPSLGGENIRLDGTLDLRVVRYVPVDFFSSMRTGHLKPSDIIINTIGAHTGKVGRYLGEYPEAAINGNISLIRGSDDIYQDFLFYYLQSPKAQQDIGMFIMGSAQPYLDDGFFTEMLVPFPSGREQRQISEILNEVSKAIDFTKSAIMKWRKICVGLASDILDGKSTSSDDTGEYRECRIGDLGSVVGGGTPSRDKEEYWNGPVPWLTPGELTGTNDKIISKSKERISELGLTASSARLVPAGSLLVTSRASIGFCALAGVDLATNQGFQNLIPNADSVDSSFLYYLGRTLKREMTRCASGTTFLEIPKREFERIKVRLPPIKEQRRIARILDDIADTIQANRRQLEKLRQLRAGLADDLFSGKVRTVAE